MSSRSHAMAKTSTKVAKTLHIVGPASQQIKRLAPDWLRLHAEDSSIELLFSCLLFFSPHTTAFPHPSPSAGQSQSLSSKQHRRNTLSNHLQPLQEKFTSACDMIAN